MQADALDDTEVDDACSAAGSCAGRQQEEALSRRKAAASVLRAGMQLKCQLCDTHDVPCALDIVLLDIVSWQPCRMYRDVLLLRLLLLMLCLPPAARSWA